VECNQNMNLIHKVISTGKPYIRAIACYTDSELPYRQVVFELIFDEMKLFVYVDACDDSIIVSESLPLSDAYRSLSKNGLKSGCWLDIGLTTVPNLAVSNQT
jgi:hypothetical protein